MSNARAVLKKKIRRGEPVTEADFAAAFPPPAGPKYEEGGRVVIYTMMDPKVAEEKLRLRAEAQSKGLLVAGEAPAAPEPPPKSAPAPPETAPAPAPATPAPPPNAVPAPAAPAPAAPAAPAGPAPAPGSWTSAKAAISGGPKPPVPSQNKCPDPTCTWPNSEDATTCVRCGHPLAHP